MGLKVSNIILMDHEPWVACPWYFWDFRIETLGVKMLGCNHCNSNIVDLAPSSLWFMRAPEMSTIFGLQSLFKSLFLN